MSPDGPAGAAEFDLVVELCLPGGWECLPGGWEAVPAAVWKSPHSSRCPDPHGGGWLFASLIPSFIAGGGSLENVQLFTIQLMYTLAEDCG